MTHYEHIPVWLRITNRIMIDPEYRDQWSKAEASQRMDSDKHDEIAEAPGTVKAIAEEFGVSVKTVYRIKKGRR